MGCFSFRVEIFKEGANKLLTKYLPKLPAAVDRAPRDYRKRD